MFMLYYWHMNVFRQSSCVLLLGVALSGGAAMSAGFWGVSQESGKWQAVDPDGRLTPILGVDHVQWRGMACQALGNRRLYHEHNLTNYPSKAAWEAETIARLRSWGFNSLGAGCDEALNGRALASFSYLRVSDEFCRGNRERFLCEYRFAPCTAFPNVFGEAFAARCEEIARMRCAAAREENGLLGYFIDNELAWNGCGRGPTGLFDAVNELDAAHSAKRALETFLANHVAGGRTAFESLDSDARMKVKLDFVRLIAERYFATTVAAIRRHDPNHLIFGCRFAGLDGAPPPVWEVAGRHCDVVTFNCYPWADLTRNMVFDRLGGRPITACFDEIHRLTGRPLMITEWSFPALDAGMPCLHGAGQRFRTQGERAAASALFARTMLSLPFVIGYDYFMWVDEPALGMNRFFPEDSNYGLVSERGIPYSDLTSALARVHEEALQGRVCAPKPTSVSRPVTPTERMKFSNGRRSSSPVTFLRTGDAWSLAAEKGVRLSGCVGARPAAERISLGDVDFGKLALMVQTKKDERTSDWLEVTRVAEVTGESGSGLGNVTVSCLAERKERPCFEVVVRMSVAADSRAFLVELLSVTNLTGDRTCVENLLVRPFAADAGPQGVRLPLDLWRGERDCQAEWTFSDGRLLSARSGDVGALHFSFWCDDKGVQHPDARFGWERPWTLNPQETLDFGETMGMLISLTPKGGTDE